MYAVNNELHKFDNTIQYIWIYKLQRWHTTTYQNKDNYGLLTKIVAHKLVSLPHPIADQSWGHTTDDTMHLCGPLNIKYTRYEQLNEKLILIQTK